MAAACPLFVLLLLSLSCTPQSYPEEKIEKHLQEICKAEYKIDNVQIKFAGKTMGVYFPLEKLFSTEFEEILAKGMIHDISTLLQFNPEALDKVEDVLFSTSRVILSTDKPVDFYTLKATDTEATGISLILTGYVQDIKRVRFWDIPRSEYRKRVQHELKVNYIVLWKRPVVDLFNDIGKKEIHVLLEKYFVPGTNLQMISPLFYSEILESRLKSEIHYRIQEVRGTSASTGEALIYVKVKEDFVPKKEYANHPFLIPSGFESEYIFILMKRGSAYRILRVVPFYYLGDDGQLKKVAFPEELRLSESIETWHEEFEVEEVSLNDFLAQQLTRRIQTLLNEDERIHNTFDKATVLLDYQRGRKGKEGREPREEESGFQLVLELLFKEKSLGENIWGHEDLVYLLDVALREFVSTLRGYWFDQYETLVLKTSGTQDLPLDKGLLELYRQKKIKIDGLLAEVS